MKKIHILICLFSLVSTIASSQNTSDAELVSVEANSKNPSGLVEIKSKFRNIDKSQFCKKWYVVDSSIKNNLGPKEKEDFNKLMKGNFIQFDVNNDYIVKMGGVEKKGKWDVNHTNTDVIFIEMNGNKANFWRIIEIGETNLILHANNGVDWTFSTKKE